MSTEVRIPHFIEYETPDLVPVSEVIETLRGAERLLIEIKPLLEGIVPGLEIEKIRVSVAEISQRSPLKELFFASIFIAFQKDLEEEVPKLIDDLFGTQITGQYDTLVTVAFCLVLFYGADFVYRQVNKAAASSNIKKQLDGLIKEIAEKCGCSEERVRIILEERYGKSRLRSIAAGALRFFRPSKSQGSVPIKVGERKFGKEVISEVPSDVTIAEFEDEEPSEEIKNVEIELHAQDIDRSKQGWAGVVPAVSKKRLRMEIYPTIKPEQIYTRPRVRGDVIVVSKRNEDGELEPYMFHLMKLADG